MPLSVRGETPAAWSPRPRRGVVAAEDLVATARPMRRVSWGYDGLMLPWQASVTVEGPPGQGKSTWATYAALALAQAVDVLFVAVEEQGSSTLTERLVRCRRSVNLSSLPRRLRISDARTPHEVDEDLQGFEGVVVLDSLTDLDARPEWVSHQLERENVGWVLIQHWTTGRAPRGGLEPAYTADVRAVADGFRLKLAKNRWGGPCADVPIGDPLPLSEPQDSEVLSFPGGL